MKQDIEIIRGTTNKLLIDVKDSDGTAYTLANGEKLIFGVKANKSQSDCEILKVLTVDDATDTGVYALALSPEDTARLECGRYFYDIGLQSGSDYYCVIACSNFVIGYNIASREVT